jgi:CheY-like chemotaxis protein
MKDGPSTPRRLLVIDDDLSCRTTIAYLLQKLGHTVEAAENGFAGLALLGQKLVDLVLTDLMMPGLNGWDVARLAKAMHPGLPVVLVTGAAHIISPDQPERTWVDAILAKPFGVAAMQAVIGALTRDRSETECSAGEENVWLAEGERWPIRSPALGSGLDPPTDIHTLPSKRFVA